MLTITNKGGYMVKKCQKPVYVICEGSLMKISSILCILLLKAFSFFFLSDKTNPRLEFPYFALESEKISILA